MFAIFGEISSVKAPEGTHLTNGFRDWCWNSANPYQAKPNITITCQTDQNIPNHTTLSGGRQDNMFIMESISTETILKTKVYFTKYVFANPYKDLAKLHHTKPYQSMPGRFGNMFISPSISRGSFKCMLWLLRGAWGTGWSRCQTCKNKKRRYIFVNNFVAVKH